MRFGLKRLTHVLVLAAAFALPSLADTAHAQTAVPQPCVDSSLPSGARSRICVPLGWNGQLVVFAHGYVPVFLPLDFTDLSLADGTSLPDVVQSLGFAFATTTYRQNGLAIIEGVDDIRQLVAKFKNDYGTPVRTYMTGASEGGLITSLLAEQSPELFHSALALCGPIGSFQAQINYIGDFRVLFDYYFPGVLPGTAIDIPPALIAGWFTVYQPAVTAALAANPAKAVELLKVARAAYDPNVPATVINTALDLLRYNVFGTGDARLKLGGNPFGNRTRWYFGSRNDLRLNAQVARFTASPAALQALRAYQTSGELSIPMVTLHTTGDDIVPVTQELLYLIKFDPSARGRFVPLPVFRYGHCTFTGSEVINAFGLMLAQP